MIPDNRLYDQRAVARDLLERELRLVAQQLIQRPRVQLHRIVEVRRVNRDILETEKHGPLVFSLSDFIGRFYREQTGGQSGGGIVYLLVFPQEFGDDEVEGLLAAVLANLLRELLVVLRGRRGHHHHQ